MEINEDMEYSFNPVIVYNPASDKKKFLVTMKFNFFTDIFGLAKLIFPGSLNITPFCWYRRKVSKLEI